jgi:hypothetical protein
MKKNNKSIKDYDKPYVAVPGDRGEKAAASYKLFGIGVIGIIVIFIFCLLTSCGTYHMTERDRQINYELDKLYTEYMYKRDSLLIEYNKK